MESQLVIFLLLFHLLLTLSSGTSGGACISKGGRFPSFSSEGKPPKQVSRGAKDLTLCRVFRKRTCCDVAQTYPALLSIRRLASTGEASQECLQFWELLECSICDPHIGVQPGPPLICASFCDRVYQACADAYFSLDTKTDLQAVVDNQSFNLPSVIEGHVLAPCGVSDFVCGKGAEWVANGTELCIAAGFTVKTSDDLNFVREEAPCYGGKASLDSIADSWKSVSPHRAETSGISEDLQLWVQGRPFNEKVSWAVGGMVLTAGLIFVSKRKSYSQRQRLAALQRTAKRLEGKMNMKSSAKQGNRKAN